jgi:sigma-B regulation protein RsbU (phosphoserine phosphatase)
MTTTLDRLIDELLARLAASFRLGAEVGGRPLGEALEAAIRAAAARAMPDWGTSGPITAVTREASGPLVFAYRPHLFPGMDEALRLGHQVQYWQLPRELPTGAPVEVATVLESYCHLSGDLFGWHEDDAGFTLWLIDMSGHGLRAGFAALVFKLLITEAACGLAPAALAAEVERRFLAARNPADRVPLYATGVVLRIGRDGTASYVSAGHPPVFVRRADGAITEAGPTCLPLALFDSCEAREKALELSAGDTALLYTDGLMEAGDSEGRPFGLGRITEILATGLGRPVDVTTRLYEAVAAHHDLDRLDDDVTFLALRRTAARG